MENTEYVYLVCLECNKKFKRKMGKVTKEIRCPNCNSVDIVLDTGN